MLINITGGQDLLLHEVSEASGIIHDAADSEANIIFGAVLDESMKGQVKITVIARVLTRSRNLSATPVAAAAAAGVTSMNNRVSSISTKSLWRRLIWKSLRSFAAPRSKGGDFARADLRFWRAIQ